MRIILIVILATSAAYGNTTLHNLFSNNCVLQHGQRINIWGTDTPKQSITVSFNSQEVQTTTDQNGRWLVCLEPLEISKLEQALEVKGSTTVKRDGLLVGDVWLCSGQSNMEWKMRQFLDHDIELLASDIPSLRHITITTKGGQEPQSDINDQWNISTPETTKHFSSVGFFFGKHLTDVLDIPIGLICNAWGGSAAEAWVSPETLNSLESSKPYLTEWKTIAKNHPTRQRNYLRALENWQLERKKHSQEKKPFHQKRPRDPQLDLEGQHRPSNLWNGRTLPIHLYGVKGVIWYQGETNATPERSFSYRELFPAMINDWRKIWGGLSAPEASLPFYWVNLANHRKEQEVDPNSVWATLRESQTATLSLKNTGEAIAIDLGETEDIHPNDKRSVAMRLARHALKNDYGFTEFAAEHPQYESHILKDEQLIIQFSNIQTGLKTKNYRTIKGFYGIGDANETVLLKGSISGENKITLSGASFSKVEMIYYNWSDNPNGNVYSKEGLPLTPFRIAVHDKR